MNIKEQINEIEKEIISRQENIDILREEMLACFEKIEEIRNYCKYDEVSTDDEGISYCDICGKEFLSYCEKAPNNECVFVDEKSNEILKSCKYCGKLNNESILDDNLNEFSVKDESITIKEFVKLMLSN